MDRVLNLPVYKTEPMKRRKFVESIGLGSGLVFLPPLHSSVISRKDDADEHTINLAMLAMLGVQRRSWEQGVAAQALLESGNDDMVVALAFEALLRKSNDGRLAMVDSNEAVTDSASNGEPMMHAWKITGHEEFRKAVAGMEEYLLKKAPRTNDGVIYHVTYAPEIWSDAMYMCPPFLAATGHYAEALHQVRGYRKYLWNADKKLFSHRWNAEKKDFVRKDFWGVGNGWSAAGMTRVVQHLPDSMQQEKSEIAGYIRECLDGCLAFQREDGLFHDVVDNPSTFIETNLAQMLGYTIFRGVKAGRLPESYLQKADSMRKAAWSKVDTWGFVQGVCGSPNFDRSGTACEGQAFFLLMEAAFRDLQAK